MNAAQHRVFFALWPEAGLRASLTIATAPALAGVAGRPVLAEDLHVTLAFLGEVGSAALTALARIGATLAPPRLTVMLDRLEWWPGSGALIVAASTPPAGLMQLQQGLCRSLADAGLRVDAREFRPHLTIARSVPAQPRQALSMALAWPIGAVALVESVRVPTGPRYRPLASWDSTTASNEFHVI